MKGYTKIEAPQVFGMGDVVYNQAFAKGDLRIWISREIHGGCLRWHLSISCQKRYPTWDEIRDARYDLMPDNITMGMLLPPKAQYVNIHPNCFHLHEIVE